jgi:hypothetical protein
LTNGQNIDSVFFFFSFPHETHKEDLMSNGQEKKTNQRQIMTNVCNITTSATPKLYAAGELELEKSKKVYGLAQCTRDISASDCSKCLDGIIGELPRCCDGKEGGRVVTGSCNIRYEIYSFVTA